MSCLISFSSPVSTRQLQHVSSGKLSENAQTVLAHVNLYSYAGAKGLGVCHKHAR